MKKSLSLLAAFLICLAAGAQSSEFRHITVEQGLSSNHVRSLMQDRFGFIWVGTDKHLNRYDGHDFKTIPFPEKWAGITLLSMLEDEDFIWLGTDQGLFRYFYDNEKIEFFGQEIAGVGPLTEEVNGLCKDKDGNIWISTRGHGVCRYGVRTGTLEQFGFPDCGDNISTVYVDNSNQVWALTNWGSPILSRLNKTTDTFEEYVLMDNGRKLSDGGLVLLEDSEQRFWLGTWTDGLYEIDRITGHVTRHLSSIRGVNHIHSLVEYAPGQLAIGSDEGLLIYSVETKSHVFHAEGTYGLSSRFVYPLLKDREGGLWAGTYYGGINYRSPFTGQFKGYTHNRYSRNTVAGKVIGRFCEDGSHNIWIASDDGGLSCYNPTAGTFRNYTSADSGLSYDNVHALCVDGNELWIGTYTGGVNVLNMNTGRFRTYLPEKGNERSLYGTSSYAIMKDRDGYLWIATMEGVNRYDRARDDFERMFVTSQHVIDIDQDKDGNIWFSSKGGGVIRYDAATGGWKHYGSNEQYGEGLPSDYVNCGFLDSQGNLWFGTASGLCRYVPEKDGFETIPFPSSLSDICGIVEDQQVFWITTNRGLVRYEPSGNNIQVFSTSDGLRSSHSISNALFKASDGRIYMGTTNGFNAFYPYQIRTNHVVPDIAFIGLTVDNKAVEPGSSILEKSLICDDACVKLRHGHNALTIHYASLSYCVPDKNQYAYMLEGFDKEWNEVGNQTHATYTNLPPGKYTFLVKGTNNDAVWNEQAAALKVIVRPHPLLSIFFMILYAVLIAIIIFMGIRMFVRSTNKKHELQIEELTDQKEKEVYEAKIKFFTMIAHEIRTPVSLIIGPLENIMKNSSSIPDKVKGDLHTMERNSQRLLYLVNQLLDFRKVEQDAMIMHFSCQPVTPLLNSICERFEPTITQNGAKLTVNYPKEDFQVCVDEEALTKLVSNLLTNASKYTKDQVEVSCYICPDDARWFNISVYDNGCGISQEEQAKIFLPFYQTLENKPGTGIGLSLVKSIVELHGGSIAVESEPGRFSRFTVKLPVDHDVAAAEEDAQEQEDLADVKKEQKDIVDDILNGDVIELKPEYKPVILIVDDNEEIVKFLSDTLHDNYEVLTAFNGFEALDFLDSHPDTALVVADWMMPGMSGIDLCRKIRENMATSHIPFILLTARTDDPSKIAGMDCGADLYIEKPFSVEYLQACIKNQVTMRLKLRQRYASLPLTPLADGSGSNVDNRFLQTMTNLIEENLSDSNLSVEFLTEQMGISRSSFYNKIKSLTGSTPNELIQLMRLKKAAQLLTEHKYRISEICYMVGFNNPSYFSKCFAKQFGMKPGEFAAKSSGE